MDYEPDTGADEEVLVPREMSNLPIKACINPSLLADSSIESTRSMVEDYREEEISFYVTESFYELLEYVLQNDGEIEYRSDQNVLDYFAGRSSFDSIYETAVTVSELDLVVFDEVDVLIDEPGDVYRGFYNALPKPEPYNEYESPYATRGFRLADILFEEFVFGVMMSPILHRVKKSINTVRNVADYTVEISERYLEKLRTYIQDVKEDATSEKQALLAEWERLEERSRDRHDQPPDAPVRKIAVLRELVKDYPDTNYISYLLGGGMPAMGAGTGADMVGFPFGTAVGAGIGGIVGNYFADP